MDYGLLGGLAEGIKAGYQSYNDAKKYKEEQDRLRRQEERLDRRESRDQSDRIEDLFIKGYEKPAEGMGLVRTKLFQEEEAAKQAREDAEKQKERDLKLRLGDKQSSDTITGLLKEAKLAEYKEKQQKAAFEKTPKGRLQGLSAEQKGRVDNARLALSSVREMANALVGGNQDTFSIIGDNDFTRNRAAFEEALGRMQSGGAIGVEEARRFKKMAPTAFDSPEQQRKKLLALEQEMGQRLTTLGFNESDLGEAGYNISQVDPKTKGLLAQQPGGLIENAVAKPKVKKAPEQMSEAEMDEYIKELEAKTGMR